MSAQPTSTLTPEAGQRLLPPALRKQATQLYQQQMWLWGQDIRHPQGNLLLQYGFSKRRIVHHKQQTSEYTLRLADTGGILRLWSFGCAWFQQGQGLLLPREAFRPRLLHELPQTVVSPTAWPEAQKPRGEAQFALTYQLLGQLTHTFAAYESWALQQLGPAECSRLLKRWHQRVRIPAEQMAESWMQVASEFQLLGQPQLALAN